MPSMRSNEVTHTVNAIINDPAFWINGSQPAREAIRFLTGIAWGEERNLGAKVNLSANLQKELRETTPNIMKGLNINQQNAVYKALKYQIMEPLYGRDHDVHPENAEIFNYLKGYVGTHLFSPVSWYNTGNTVEVDEAIVVALGVYGYQNADYIVKRWKGQDTSIAAEWLDFIEQGKGVWDAATNQFDYPKDLEGKGVIVPMYNTDEVVEATGIKSFEVCAVFLDDGAGLDVRLLDNTIRDHAKSPFVRKLTASEICQDNLDKGAHPLLSNSWAGAPEEASTRAPTQADHASGLVSWAQYQTGTAIPVGARTQGYITAKITHHASGNMPGIYTILFNDGGGFGTVNVTHSYNIGDPSGAHQCTVTTSISWGTPIEQTFAAGGLRIPSLEDANAGIATWEQFAAGEEVLLGQRDHIQISSAHSTETGNFYGVNPGSWSDTSNNCRGGCYGPTTGGSCEEGGTPIPFEETVTTILIPVNLSP
jgi:hypothetical protein